MCYDFASSECSLNHMLPYKCIGRPLLPWKRGTWTLWMTGLLNGPVFSMRYQMAWHRTRLIKSSLIWYVCTYVWSGTSHKIHMCTSLLKQLNLLTQIFWHLEEKVAYISTGLMYYRICFILYVCFDSPVSHFRFI